MQKSSIYLLLIIIFSLLCNQSLLAQLPKATGVIGNIGKSSGTGGYGGPGGSSGADYAKETQFTGDVSFPLTLVTVGALEAQLQYNSNVHKQVRADNEVTPSGWVGLGWSLELGSIMGEISNTSDPRDDRYFYVDKDGSSEIAQPDSGKFLLQRYEAWKITRQDSAGFILGWEIIKEDGTILRFGNFIKDNNKFSSSNVPTYATRYMLGYRGLIMNPPARLFDSLSFIPYQWDLSDVQEINGKHTTILYQQVQAKLQIGSSSTQKYYTRETHPKTIRDNTGGEVEFVLGNMDKTEYYGDSTSYFQYVFEKKYLDSIEIKQNGEVYQKIVMSYKSWDTLHIGAKKRYLTKLEMRDKRNKSMLLRKYEYCDSSQVNPGALRQITYLGGGKVEYSYKAQELPNVQLKKIDSFMSVDDKYKPTYGLSGADFCVFREKDGSVRVYRQGSTGWNQDTTKVKYGEENPSIFGGTDYLHIASDYILYGYPYPWGTTQHPPYLAAVKRTTTGWKCYYVDSVLIQSGKSIGYRIKVLGTGPNYFVIAYNPDCDPYYQYANYQIAVVRFTEKGLSFDTLSGRYLGREYDMDEFTHLKGEYLNASCGNNYFVLTSVRFVVGTEDYLEFSHFEYQIVNQVGTWVNRKNREDDYKIFFVGDATINPSSISIGNNFVACAIGRYYEKKTNIIIYRRTGDSLREEYRETIDSAGRCPPQAIATDHYCAFNVRNQFRFFTWHGSEFLHEVNDSLFERNVVEVDDNYLTSFGNRLIACYTYSAEVIGKSMRLAAATYCPEKGQWLKGNIIEERPCYGWEFHDAQGLNKNTFIVQWTDENILNYISLRAYQYAGNSIHAVTIDSVFSDYSPEYYRSRYKRWQSGNNFVAIALGPLGQSIDPDTIMVYTMANSVNGDITFNGHPYDYVLDTMKVISGMGDTLKTKYVFENGVYDEQMNTAKYNKVTMIPPGNNGKMVTYYYNDLDSANIVNSVPDGEYVSAKKCEELDGIPYKTKIFSQDNLVTPFQSTRNFYSALAMDNEAMGIFHQQLDSMETTVDGVPSKKIFKYSPTNLLPTMIIDKVGVKDDQNGTLDKVTEIAYASQQSQYSMLLNAHMLAQPYTEAVSKRDPRSKEVQVSVQASNDEIDRNYFSVSFPQEVVYTAEVNNHPIACDGHFYIGTSLGGSNIVKRTASCMGSFQASPGVTYYIEVCGGHSWCGDYTNSGTVTYRLSPIPESDIVQKNQTTYRTSAPYLPDSSKIWDGDKTQWITTSRIVSRDGNGNIQETENVDNIRTTTKWGYKNNVPIATIVNAADVETNVIVCDEFTNSPSLYGPLANGLFELDADGPPTYTQETRGYNDWCQKVSVPVGLNGCGVYTSIQSPDQAINYIIEFDFLVEQASLEVLTTGGNPTIQATYNANAYKKQWQHAKLRWNLQNNASNKIVNFIACWDGTPSGSAIFYLDNIRIYPVDAVCTSQAYDPVTLDMISTTDENGVTRYVTKDGFGRQTAVVK